MTATPTPAPTPEVIDGTASDTGPMLVMDEVHTYYGHIHALKPEARPRIGGLLDGVRYHLAAVDFIGFRPVLIAEV